MNCKTTVKTARKVALAQLSFVNDLLHFFDQFSFTFFLLFFNVNAPIVTLWEIQRPLIADGSLASHRLTTSTLFQIEHALSCIRLGYEYGSECKFVVAALHMPPQQL